MKTMKNFTLGLIAMTIVLGTVSCSKDEGGPDINLVVGSFMYKAESIWSTADASYDLEDTLTITKVSDTEVMITGLIPWDSLGSGGGNMVNLDEVTAEVDLDAMEFKIPVGQQISGPNGNDYFLSFFPGDPTSLADYEIDVTDDEYVIGTIKDNGDIKLIGPWGLKWIEPDGTTFDGKWWWDFYTVTNMTKLTE